MNKILIFDLVGTFAHFRKFYTNSSSLSYAFPPRTVITGLLAGILGYERDKYYEEFSSENCSVGLAIKKPIRKLVQTVNYIRTKDLKELTGSGGHTQIPIEFVVPQREKDVLKYRVYVLHTNEEIMDKLREKLKTGNIVYPPYLGLTECPAEISLIDDEGKFSLINSSNLLELITVIPTDKIDKIESINFQEEYKFMKEDRVPVEFAFERRIKKVSSYIYEQNCKPIKNIKIKGQIFYVIYREEEKQIEEYGVFME
jgi:CRISPR-associated protein Cas5h